MKHIYSLILYLTFQYPLVDFGGGQPPSSVGIKNLQLSKVGCLINRYSFNFGRLDHCANFSHIFNPIFREPWGVV